MELSLYICPFIFIYRCCKMHDYCYYLTNCPKFLEYFVPYLWKCYKGKPLCGKIKTRCIFCLFFRIVHRIFFKFYSIFFYFIDFRLAINHGEWGGPGSCAATLCECDRALSKCLRRYLCPRKRAICTSSPLRLLQNLFMIIWSSTQQQQQNTFQIQITKWLFENRIIWWILFIGIVTAFSCQMNSHNKGSVTRMR